MFEHENDTIAAICTGTGGAVSIIRISGPHALDAVRKVWRGRRMPGPDFPRVMLYEQSRVLAELMQSSL